MPASHDEAAQDATSPPTDEAPESAEADGQADASHEPEADAGAELETPVEAPDEPVSEEGAEPAVEAPTDESELAIYAIGDIHGRLDLLERLMDTLEEDMAETDAPAKVVFLGDYIDRGGQSCQVIDFLLSDRVKRLNPEFLRGNHEETMMDFMADETVGPTWAKYGGRETMVSYGVRPPRSMSFNREWRQAHGDFVAAVSGEHQKFLMQLRSSLRIGSFGFVHAGIRPGVPFDKQTDHDLLWIRDEFLDSQEKFEITIVHGHTPVDDAHAGEGRINVDTGAYYSGRLTAVKLYNDQVKFLST